MTPDFGRILALSPRLARQAGGPDDRRRLGIPNDGRGADLAIFTGDRGILPDTLRGVPIQSSDARHRRRVKGRLGVHRSWAFN